MLLPYGGAMQMFRGVLALSMLLIPMSVSAGEPSDAGPLTLIVMDPLAAPLAAGEVPDYARRKYESLGNSLSQRLQRPVRVYWNDSLVTALEEKTGWQADLVIGMHSVVLHHSAQCQYELRPIASLTERDGSVVHRGMIVVRGGDPARSLSELSGYRIFFGPLECAARYATPRDLLAANAVESPELTETYPDSQRAVAKLFELESQARAAAVISSHAAPWLNSAGLSPDGLRVVAACEPVPFITAFASAALTPQDQAAIRAALLSAGDDARLRAALQSAEGFVPFQPTESSGSRARESSVSQSFGAEAGVYRTSENDVGQRRLGPPGL
jgi:ABC-type phosphate/phosphonate transport system substrate-binding protein